MSSILKALQKLEQEKLARRSGNKDIAAKVVRTGRKPRQFPRWLFPATVSLTALFAVLVTYLVMRVPTTPKTALRNEPATSARIITPATLPALPIQQEMPAPQIPAAGNLPSALPANASPPIHSKLPTPITRQQPDQPTPPPPIQEAPQKTLPTAAPEQSNLKISGIAWQKDSSSRLAVVNGIAVIEGNVIEGAKVEEILPDRVRFSRAGERFEVHLGKNDR